MYAWLINSINALIRGIGFILKSCIGFLPNSPFVLLDNSPIAQFLPTLNYFLPINEMISVGEAWLAVIITYYFYQAVLRTINLIE